MVMDGAERGQRDQRGPSHSEFVHRRWDLELSLVQERCRWLAVSMQPLSSFPAMDILPLLTREELLAILDESNLTAPGSRSGSARHARFGLRLS